MPSGSGTQPPPSSSYLREVSPSPLACVNRALRTARRAANEGGPAPRYDLVIGLGGLGSRGVGSVGLWAVVRSPVVGSEYGD